MSMVLLAMSTLIVMQSVDASAKIKTKKYTLDLRGGGTLIRQPSVVKKAKRVKVKSSKKSVVKAKYLKKKKEIYLKAKKKGSAIVYVTCRMKNGKVQKIRYKIKVIRTKPLTPLQQSKNLLQFKISTGKRKVLQNWNGRMNCTNSLYIG